MIVPGPGHDTRTANERTAMTTTPTHQLPTSCHVCGAPAAPATGRPTCSHDWTNAEALAEAREHDRRVIAAGGPVYSSGARNAEAAYVAEHVPDAYLATEVAAGRACGQHDRPRPCLECEA